MVGVPPPPPPPPLPPPARLDLVVKKICTLRLSPSKGTLMMSVAALPWRRSLVIQASRSVLHDQSVRRQKQKKKKQIAAAFLGQGSAGGSPIRCIPLPAFGSPWPWRREPARGARLSACYIEIRCGVVHSFVPGQIFQICRPTHVKRGPALFSIANLPSTR